MALLTSDLHTVMMKDPAFLGVFALDRVPPIIKKGNVKLIINLDPATKPGSHWVAIWRKGNTGYYYDSFGRIPPPALGAWLARNSDSWTYNKKLMQSPKDKTACGYLCISFLTNKFSI
jgi:hypothetical protein